jgi:predicted RecB family nuclease
MLVCVSVASERIRQQQEREVFEREQQVASRLERRLSVSVNDIAEAARIAEIDRVKQTLVERAEERRKRKEAERAALKEEQAKRAAADAALRKAELKRRQRERGDSITLYAGTVASSTKGSWGADASQMSELLIAQRAEKERQAALLKAALDKATQVTILPNLLLRLAGLIWNQCNRMR